MKVKLGNGEVVKIQNYRRGYGILSSENKEERKSKAIEELIEEIKDHSHDHSTSCCRFCNVYVGQKHSHNCLYRKVEEIGILIKGGWL